MNEIAKLPLDKLVYVDESGIDTFISREYGWQKRGVKVKSDISGRRYARESFIAGIIGKKVIAPFCYQGTCDTSLFNTWLEKMLLPNLSSGHVIIMDNAAFHKSEKTRELIEQAGNILIYLPPYSPDLNPIEKYWANLKSKIKKVIGKFKTLADAIDWAFVEDQ